MESKAHACVCVCSYESVYAHWQESNPDYCSSEGACLFCNRVPIWCGTYQICQTGWLEGLVDPPVSTPLVLGLEVCITTPGLFHVGIRDGTHVPMLVRQALN